jgi:DNA-binding MarR family transcriptional regulator
MMNNIDAVRGISRLEKRGFVSGRIVKKNGRIVSVTVTKVTVTPALALALP